MSKEKKTSIPQGILSRSTELLGLLAKVGTKSLSQKVEQATQKITSSKNSTKTEKGVLAMQIEQAKLVAESFGRLKGAAMKVGQMLSVEGRDLLPAPVIEVLSRLQDQSPPVPFYELRKVLQEDLGPEKMSQIKDLSENALAAASIGQVHRATYQGKDIVLKIQYPGIAEAVDSDILLLRKVITNTIGFSSRKIDFHPLFDELHSVLKAEVNYLREASNFEKYQKIISFSSYLKIPKVYPELCGPRVLAMSFEPGLKLSAYKDSKPSQEERLHYAHLFLNLFIEEFIRNGFVQTDPNFANFLFRPSDKSLILLDLGACKEYDPEFIGQYRNLLKAVYDKNFEQILQQSIAMDFIKENESPECLDLYIKMLLKSVEPFEESKQPFDYMDNTYAEDVREISLKFLKEVRYSAPPHKLIFLHRKLGGLFQILKSLEVQVDLQPYWKKITENLL